MKKAFRFEYLDVTFAATAEVFFEGGLVKYRVAYDSQLIVIRELLHTIGSTGYLLFVQDVEPDEPALPAEFIQAIGWELEEIEFFPGSFWVEYIMQSGRSQAVQFLRKGNAFTMVYAVPAIEGLRLPYTVTRRKVLGLKCWQQLSGLPRQVEWKKLINAIEEYEKGIIQ